MIYRTLSPTRLAFPATRGWVEYFIGCHLSEFIETRNTQQEEPQLQILPIFPDETISCMRETVYTVEAIWYSIWTKSGRSQTEAGLGSRQGQTVQDGISWNLKHISIIAEMFAREACLASYMVTSQATEQVRLCLGDMGMRIRQHLISNHRQKPSRISMVLSSQTISKLCSYLTSLICEETRSYPTRKPCYEWRTIHLASLHSDGRRTSSGCQGSRGNFQFLDLALFGVPKRRGQSRLSFFEEKRTAEFIKKLYHDFQLMTIEADKQGTFEEVELEFSRRDGSWTFPRRIYFGGPDEPNWNASRGLSKQGRSFFSHFVDQNSCYGGFKTNGKLER
jgi:hypothetical protein